MPFFSVIMMAVLWASPSSAKVWYISPFVGDGTEQNPFHAYGADTGGQCRSIRPDETKLAGRAICVGDTVPAQSGVFQIPIDKLTKLTAAQKTAIQNAIGQTITADNIPDAIWQILDALNVSFPKTKNGLQRFIVGGVELTNRPAPLSAYIPDILHGADVVFHLPFLILDYAVSLPLAWASTVRENWNCPDSASLTCQLTWTNFQGAALTLASNHADMSGSVSVQLSRTDGVATEDHRVGVTVSNINRNTATEINGGVIGRKQTGTNTQTYLYCVARDAATDQIEYGHAIAGVRTADGTFNTTVTNGDLVELLAFNDTQSCYQNGTLVLGPISTDASVNGFTAGGIRMAGTGTVTGTNVSLDNWTMTDVSASFGPLRRR